MAKTKRKVNWIVALVFSVIFGSLGVDRFIMGKVGTGLLKLFTFGGFGIWWIVDIILIATKHEFENVQWVD
ncbi:TM2 domain-containing protein [Candidatus Pacearchaeota archaeon]|nr:TM2 domain-containing protein [Candidatus Pacearchaeota archaeon]